MYNTEKDTWMPRAGLCEPRASLSAVAVDDKIFALGGHNGLNALRSVEIYDVDTNSWSATTGVIFVELKSTGGIRCFELSYSTIEHVGTK